MIYFGTSGFNCNDWVGSFYPLGMPKREWFTCYACEFNICEVNSTFYALPKPSSLKAMAEKTGGDFIFSIKANQEMTHQREDKASVFKVFCQVLEPIIAAGKLGCILAQFPYSFGFDRRNWDYLRFFKERLAEVTSTISHVRFHRRNSAKWWQHEQDYERYGYSYTPQELSEWLPKIKKLDSVAEKAFFFANNHWRGQAVSTIR